VDVNTIMSVVTERFGSKADTVLGAVIDDSIRSQVEICVIGTTDVGTHRIARSGSRSLVGVGTKAATAAPVAASISSARQAEKTPLPEIDDSEERRVHESKLRNKSQEKHVEQDEFFFTSEGEQRGYFDKTDRNMWEGEDLDIPTYLRRGVRIVL
jgi:cell division protein FtsZ